MRILPFIIVILLSIIIFVTTVKTIKNNYALKLEAVRERVGQYIIVEKDTFLITDYSFIRDRYKTLQGKEFSVYFVENNSILLVQTKQNAYENQID